MAEQILISPARMKELHTAIERGTTDVQQMIDGLVDYKGLLDAQGISESSLVSTYNYCDALISMMELLSDSLQLLGENATQISETFRATDEDLAMVPCRDG
ncbi:hypothetical protein [Numidum massiliense]|uniref:hypothetical protein n=1 Tax=Numidum massiliense TaxID=1522315 RepID=UPI0006D5AA5C|nr:hypothetical protein [Numidum massiliense]